MQATLEQFLDDWEIDEFGVRQLFIALRDHLAKKSGVGLSFKGRPGISYSLRASHASQTQRELFVLVDVIDDEPEERWLSICFYADSLTQEQLEQGDLVPGGLGGEDACCFDVSEGDEDIEDFLTSCLDTASTFACK